MSVAFAHPRPAAVPARAGSLAAALDLLDHALTEVAAAAHEAVTDVEVADAALRLTTARHRMAGVDAAVLGRLQRGAHWATEGFPRPAAWLGARTTESMGSVRARLRDAMHCDQLPVLADHLTSGTVSIRHLHVVADAHHRYPALRPALRAIEPELAAYAATATPEDLRTRLAATLHRIDPDAVDRAEADRMRHDAGLHATPLLDGWGKLDALLPPDIFAKLLTLLDSARAALRLEAAGDGSEAGDPHEGAGDVAPGTRRRRRLQAFDRVLDAALQAAGTARLPDTGGSRPVVTITIPVDAVLDPRDLTTGATADATSGSRHDPGWIDRTRAHVTDRTLHRLLCDATVRRLLVTPEGLPLDIGRTTRVIPPHIRAAVHARDRGRCRFPGCRHPIDQIHHVRHWSDGGPTCQANLLGLCWQHHALVHHDGWTLTGDPDGRITVSGRLGATWVSDAPGART